MRALLSVLLIAALAVPSSGCALFGKKDGSGERHGGFSWFKKKDTGGGGAGPPPPKFPGSNDPLLTPPGAPAPTPPAPTAQAAVPTEIALLAGRVVDSYNRPLENTYIRLINLNAAKDKDKGTPEDVKTDSHGYFTIPGLKSGGQYQLIARSKQGEKLLAGITYAQAPDPRVVIEVKEEFATSSIPPLPTPAAAPASQERPEKRGAKPSAHDKNAADPQAAAWTPTPAAALTNPASPSGGVDLPAKVTVPQPAAPAAPVAGAPNRNWLPTLQIGPKKKATPVPPPTAPQAPPLPAPSEMQGNLTPLVPSCVVVGGYVQTMALNDVDGLTWNFHKDRRGKLVLLDFWTMSCTPCKMAMPGLSQLQNRFGAQGLEVVGVALETGPVKDQANRVRALCHNLKTSNYRQLLGQDDKTNLRAQFDVHAFPTLILVDDTGHILWRHVGAPDAATLDSVIQKHLTKRPF